VPVVAALTDAAGANVLPPTSAPGLAAAVAVRDAPADVPDASTAEDEKWALADLSLSVKAGQLAALVGPSGSGKTTLTYLVPRLHEVTQGAVLVDGTDVRDVTLGSLADVVGMVTQEPYLFHGTITENLRYARVDATDAEIVDACRAANIHDRIMSFAEGYETITGERGFRLSGGEKQRLSIARVLIKDPRILILDEATSALDTATERLVQQALERAMADRTTFAIAHRLSTIMNADVIFGIADGRLVEQGTHDELLARGGLYARLYEEQFGGGAVEARLADAVRFRDGTLLHQAPTHAKPDLPV
jgi:ATP-binding cassette subfamily B protein